MRSLRTRVLCALIIVVSLVIPWGSVTAGEVTNFEDIFLSASSESDPITPSYVNYGDKLKDKTYVQTNSELFTRVNEVEPNDTIAKAQLIKSGYYGQAMYKISGSMSVASLGEDADVYRVDVSRQGYIELMAFWTENMTNWGWEKYMQLVLLDTSGNWVVALLINEPLSPEDTVAYMRAHVTPGTYYVALFVEGDEYNPNSDFAGEYYALYMAFRESIPTVVVFGPPSGPTNPMRTTSHAYTVEGAFCSLGHSVQYQYSWGDGTQSTWSTNQTRTKQWNTAGNFNVCVRARCATNTSYVSAWSDALTVTVAPLPSFAVDVTVIPTEEATISGTGIYETGTVVTVTAYPIEGFRLGYWEEGDVKLGYNPSYTFTVTQDRMINAHIRESIFHERIYGNNRYLTAQEISMRGWNEGASVAFLARGDNYADALAGVPLAYQMNGPILLTGSTSLSTAARDEILRLGVSQVIILGGTGAISDAVAAEVAAIDLGGHYPTVQRISGANRYETAALIAQRMLDEGGSFTDAFVAVGTNFPDALSAAAYAAMAGKPILLTATSTIPAATQHAIDTMGIMNVVVVGGPSVINDTVYNGLPDHGASQRIYGSNRYATSVNLATTFGDPQGVIYLATGLNFPDAITGAVLAAKQQTGILLIDGSQSAPGALVRDYIFGNDIHQVNIFGGTGAVSQGMGLWF